MTITAYASTLYFPHNSTNKKEYHHDWVTIAYSTGGGMSCNAMVLVDDNSADWTDVRMLGASGNVIWSENMAIRSNHHRTFYCGSDVYTLQIRTNLSGVTGYAWAYQVP